MEVESVQSRVVLYDRDMNPNTYDIGNGVRLYAEDGTARDFISASPVETTVQPDFSDGDMEVLPAEDKLFSKVTIEKPETLIPENIAKDVEIAGIVGTLAGGGCKCASGTFTGNGSYVTVEHGLGVVPDVIFVYKKTKSQNTSIKCIDMAFGMSAALTAKVGANRSGAHIESSKYSSNGNYHSISINDNSTLMNIEDTGSTTYLASANENSFRVGITLTTVSLGRTEADATYYWLAIGGLT